MHSSEERASVDVESLATLEPLTDRMEELFGDGVKIKEVSFKRTNKPVTWNVDNILTDAFWQKTKEWNAKEKENWKKTVQEAGGLNNMSNL